MANTLPWHFTVLLKAVAAPNLFAPVLQMLSALSPRRNFEQAPVRRMILFEARLVVESVINAPSACR